MILRHPQTTTLITRLKPVRLHQNQNHVRNLHARIPTPPIPSPTPFVPDVPTFLSLIGRSLSTHASKIPDWSALFTLSSAQLRVLGVEPARTRRYLLRWRDKFMHGEFGVGGDLPRVKDGKGVVRLCEVGVKELPEAMVKGGKGGVNGPVATLTRSPGRKKVLLNVEHDVEGAEEGQSAMIVPKAGLSTSQLKDARPILGVKQKGAHTVYGSHVEPIKGTGGAAAVIRVKEGMWEHVRGHKVDGGERRKAEVRSKRRAAQRKAGRA